jgi:spore germination protein KC
MMLFMIDEMHGGVLTCHISEGSSNYFTLSVAKSTTKLSYEVGEDGRVTFHVKVRIETFLSQTDEVIDMLDKATIEKYETFAQIQLNKGIEETAERVQQEYGADIFGFGNYIHDTDPHLWEQLKENWEEHFRNAVVVADTEISITNTEYMKS